mgnify:CR=1 FL=1
MIIIRPQVTITCNYTLTIGNVAIMHFKIIKYRSVPLYLFHSTDNEETGLDKLRDLFKDAQFFMGRSNLLGSTQSA